MATPSGFPPHQPPRPGSRVDFDWSRGALAEGLRLYDSGDYFTAHEAWESVWLSATEPDKTFLQGVIQVTAAFHHLQRGNSLGATRLLTAALRKLDPYPPTFAGLNLPRLRDDIRDRLATLSADPSIANLSPPPIQPYSPGAP